MIQETQVSVPFKKKKKDRKFHSGPVVRTLLFHYHSPGSIPGWGTKIPQAPRCSQTEKKKKERKKEKINRILSQFNRIRIILSFRETQFIS